MKKINNLRFLPRISEAEKRRRNPTYRNARKSYTKNLLFFFPVWIILLIVLVFVITNIENRILAGIVGLFLAASPIMGLGIACNLSLRLWVCPHCGKELPVQHIQYVSLPVYTAQCPGCGYSLEETIPSSASFTQTSCEQNQRIDKKRKLPASFLYFFKPLLSFPTSTLCDFLLIITSALSFNCNDYNFT